MASESSETKGDGRACWGIRCVPERVSGLRGMFARWSADNEGLCSRRREHAFTGLLNSAGEVFSQSRGEKKLLYLPIHQLFGLEGEFQDALCTSYYNLIQSNECNKV